MGNRRDEIQISVPLAVLPALAYAISIGRTTAKMCGHPFAAENLALINDSINARMPTTARLFDEYVFCELCAAIHTHPTWNIAFQGWPYSFSKQGQIVVSIGKQRFITDRRDFDVNGSEVEALTAFLEEISTTREERDAELANRPAPPITPKRARELLVLHNKNRGRDICYLMSDEEAVAVRAAWLKAPGAARSISAYLDSFAFVETVDAPSENEATHG